MTDSSAATSSERAWPTRAELWAALSTARTEERDCGNPWHGVLDRLLAHSVFVETLTQVTRILEQAREGDSYSVRRQAMDAISADLPGPDDEDRRLMLLTARAAAYMRSSTTAVQEWELAVHAYTACAQAAITAVAAGRGPANAWDRLPGEPGLSPYHLDQLPILPAGIPRWEKGYSLLGTAERGLEEVEEAARGARELCEWEDPDTGEIIDTSPAEHMIEEYDALLEEAERLPEALADWATAVSWTLATTLRGRLTPPVPAACDTP
ncbi:MULTISPECIES: hypothetical protein [unclassified Crossiella]|uniref:hypothetical protein n=1 Tax=unclassified Crossiella TaxID=2620835 RepID=UPI001FFE68CF|nr:MULTISPECIES: hypothetical protein [unclassified Crossiella]MCK2242159.1 hypothetical protein [Crossiella sp. S99.2]MCK2256062.1 hypothetical protein [Crossiella sp. S99.1]